MCICFIPMFLFSFAFLSVAQMSFAEDRPAPLLKSSPCTDALRATASDLSDADAPVSQAAFADAINEIATCIDANSRQNRHDIVYGKAFLHGDFSQGIPTELGTSPDQGEE